MSEPPFVRVPRPERRNVRELRPLLLRPVEAAQLLGISKSTVYKMMANRELPTVMIGTSPRINALELEKWVNGATIRR